jgi:hypothetical protein
MYTSLHIGIRRTAFLLAVVALSLVAVASAQAGSSPTTYFPETAAVKAASASWAAKAKLLDVNGRAVSNPFTVTPAIQAASASWAAKAKLLGVNGQLVQRPSGSGGGVDWGDFGIGAAAMLGLVLLGSGLAAGAYYSRRGVRPRPAS